MVAGGLERAVDAAEHAAALVLDGRQLAMHRHGRPHHRAAEHLPDRLVAKADAEQRNGRGRGLDQVEADAGIVRVQGPGDSTIASGSAATTSAAVTLSLRCTTTSAPNSPR